MTNFSVNPVESGATYGTEPASTTPTTPKKAYWEKEFSDVLLNGGNGYVDNSSVSLFAHRPVNCAEDN